MIIFADIIKIVTMCNKTIFKATKKLTELKNAICICIFWYSKFADFQWKMLMLAQLKGCVNLLIYFLDLLKVSYNCAKSHHCKICVTDFR